MARWRPGVRTRARAGMMAYLDSSREKSTCVRVRLNEIGGVMKETSEKNPSSEVL
jgi:hypothetical protein